MTANRTARETKLEDAIRRLLRALDKQHYGGQPPGKYHYSLSVTDAMAGAAGLLAGPPAKPELKPEDEATVDAA
jgi:hypothetical protein